MQESLRSYIRVSSDINLADFTIFKGPYLYALGTPNDVRSRRRDQVEKDPDTMVCVDLSKSVPLAVVLLDSR